MVEVFANPESVPLWIAAGQGRPDWDAMFEGYNAMVDYPGAAYWRELAAYWPEAKVLHTTRDPDQWFTSTQATIFRPGSPTGPMKPFFESFTRAFGEHIHDRDWMTDYFRRHDEAVRREIPAERLLVYQAGQGWAPLCAFLGVAVPDEPYPSENNTAEFQARVAARDG